MVQKIHNLEQEVSFVEESLLKRIAKANKQKPLKFKVERSSTPYKLEKEHGRIKSNERTLHDAEGWGQEGIGS